MNLLSRLAKGLRRERPLGALGERAAARHLKQHGYRVLARNVRSRIGEVDLIVEDRGSGAIALVEVKTVRREQPAPEHRVNRAKQRKLTHLALDLIKRHQWQDKKVRFDVIAVVWPAGSKEPSRLTHHVNAFEATR